MFSDYVGFHILPIFMTVSDGSHCIDYRFRVAAIDHGFLSFTDVHLSQWPVILVTNPKNVNYMIGNKEPIEVLRNSSHVR